MSKKRLGLGTKAILSVLLILFVGAASFFIASQQTFQGYTIFVENVKKGDISTVTLTTPPCQFVSGEGCVERIKGLVVLNNDFENSIFKFNEFGSYEFGIDTINMQAGSHRLIVMANIQNSRSEGPWFFLEDYSYRFYLDVKDGKWDGKNIFMADAEPPNSATCNQHSSNVQCCINNRNNPANTAPAICFKIADPVTATLNDGGFYKNIPYPPTIFEVRFDVFEDVIVPSDPIIAPSPETPPLEDQPTIIIIPTPNGTIVPPTAIIEPSITLPPDATMPTPIVITNPAQPINPPGKTIPICPQSVVGGDVDCGENEAGTFALMDLIVYIIGGLVLIGGLILIWLL